MKAESDISLLHPELKGLEKFCNNHKRIYIYGIANNQRVIRNFLEKYGINIAGYVVSQKGASNEDGVFSINEIAGGADKSEVGFVVGILNVHYNAVLQTIAGAGWEIGNIFLMSEFAKRIILLKNQVEEEQSETNSNLAIDSYISYLDYVKSKCKKGQYNLFLHRHLGDTIFCLGMKDEFEKKYGKPLHYLIQEKQEVLAKIYGIENYTVIDFKRLMNEPGIEKYSAKIRDEYKENLCWCIFPGIPQEDNPFIAMPSTWVRERACDINFTDEWGKMLGLHVSKIQPPKYIPEISKELEEEILGIADWEHIVLIAPDAQSTLEDIEDGFWNELVENLNSEGYKCILNSMGDKRRIPGAYKIDMSVSDLIALGFRCHSIYSMRSGLCDCLVSRGTSLHVYCTRDWDYEYYSLNECFELEEQVDEIVLE